MKCIVGSVCTECFLLQSEGGVVPQATIVECGAQMLVRGNISSRAFVHAKATVAEATQVSANNSDVYVTPKLHSIWIATLYKLAKL